LVEGPRRDAVYRQDGAVVAGHAAGHLADRRGRPEGCHERLAGRRRCRCRRSS
jgi:hypothetical protein